MVHPLSYVTRCFVKAAVLEKKFRPCNEDGRTGPLSQFNGQISQLTRPVPELFSWQGAPFARGPTRGSFMGARHHFRSAPISGHLRLSSGPSKTPSKPPLAAGASRCSNKFLRTLRDSSHVHLL